MSEARHTAEKVQITHGLAEALGGLIRDQLRSIEERHQAEIRRLREGIERLADTIHGDSGWEHSGGCEGEPDCLACIEADLRALLTPAGKPTSGKGGEPA